MNWKVPLIEVKCYALIIISTGLTTLHLVSVHSAHVHCTNVFTIL